MDEEYEDAMSQAPWNQEPDRWVTLRLVTVAVVALVLVVLMAWWVHRHDYRCEEDQACWNCQTMGNHICGPTVP